MRKDWLGWRQVYPLKNEDGSWNYPNLLFGGYRNVIFLILTLGALLFLVIAYKHDTASCLDLMSNLKENACNLCYNTPSAFSLPNFDVVIRP